MNASHKNKKNQTNKLSKKPKNKQKKPPQNKTGKRGMRHIIQYIQIGFQFLSRIVICPLIRFLRLFKIFQNSICQSVSEVCFLNFGDVRQTNWFYCSSLGSDKTGEVLVALLIKLKKKKVIC